jgi:hypothetical protein
MMTPKSQRNDKDLRRMIEFFSQFEFLKYQEPALLYYQTLMNMSALKIYREQQQSVDDHLGGVSLAMDNEIMKQANQTAGTSFKFLNFDRSSIPTPIGTNQINDS